MNEEFWSKYYKETHKVIEKPSSFAKFLIEKTPYFQDKTLRLLDIGCGNGRDSFYFLQTGIDSYGIDSCKAAIEKNSQKLLSISSDYQQKFFVVDINNINLDKKFSVENYGYIYSRFFVHAIDKEESSVFFSYLGKAKKGTYLALEFRTDKDRLYISSDDRQDEFAKTDHYRRFVNFNDIYNQILDNNYEILQAVEQSGLSVLGEDDPVLGRIIAKKE